MKKLLLFFVLFSQNLLSVVPQGYGKWEFECSNLNFQIWDNQIVVVPPFCADPKMPLSFRQIHTIIHSLYQSPRSDIKKNSIKILKKYECENEIACREFIAIFEIFNEKNINKIQMKPKLINQISEILKKNKSKLNSSFPSGGGFCPPEAKRTYWIENLYQMFCPKDQVASSGKNLFTTHKGIPQKYFEHLLGMYSSQTIMSSSYISKLEHQGVSEDCEKPWKIKIECSGFKNITYHLSCQKTSGKVACTEKQ